MKGQVVLGFGVGALLAATACAPASLRTLTDEYGRQVSIVDTGSDEAGGKRMAVIGQFYRNGAFVPHAVADGPGTFQTTIPALIQGAAFAGGSVGAAALLRPAISNYTDNSSVSQVGAGVASGAVAVKATGGKTGDVQGSQANAGIRDVSAASGGAQVGPITLGGATAVGTGYGGTGTGTGGNGFGGQGGIGQGGRGGKGVGGSVGDVSSSSSKLNSNIKNTNQQMQTQMQHQDLKQYTMIDNKNLGNGKECPGKSCLVHGNNDHHKKLTP